MSNAISWLGASRSVVLGSGLAMACAVHAGMVRDAHGNVGYDSAAECDAAVAAGDVRFYQSFTDHPPLKRVGETDVKVLKLKELVQAQKAAAALGYAAAGYAKGSTKLKPAA